MITLAIQKSARRLGGTRLSWKLRELTDYIVIPENTAMHEALIQSTHTQRGPTHTDDHKQDMTSPEDPNSNRHIWLFIMVKAAAQSGPCTHLLTNQGFFGAWLRLGINIFTYFHNTTRGRRRRLPDLLTGSALLLTGSAVWILIALHGDNVISYSTSAATTNHILETPGKLGTRTKKNPQQQQK